MHAGERIELTLTDLSYLGGAVGRTSENLAVFATGGLPGEQVVVEIEDVRRHYARGRVLEIHQPAAERTEPPCPYFGRCGGCQWQHMTYTAELRWKEEIVRRQLLRIGHLEDPPVQPIIAAAHPWNYRNHARFSVDATGRLCFTRFQTRQLLPIEICHIMQPPIVALMPRLQGLLPVRTRSWCGAEAGLVRYLSLRRSLFLPTRFRAASPGTRRLSSASGIVFRHPRSSR